MRLDGGKRRAEEDQAGVPDDLRGPVRKPRGSVIQSICVSGERDGQGAVGLIDTLGGVRVRAGRLDRRLTLQRRTLTENDYGEAVETWTDLATVWAEKIPVRGAERYAAMQTVAEVDTRFKIRYRTDVSHLDRVVCAGTTYDVKGVLEIGRREGWEIYATARAE